MKKVIIGAIFLICGICATLSIIHCAVGFLPHLTAWSTDYPSRLFYVIFAGESRFDVGEEGLGLDLFFILGIVMAVSGIAILVKEYFSKGK